MSSNEIPNILVSCTLSFELLSSHVTSESAAPWVSASYACVVYGIWFICCTVYVAVM